LREEYRERTQCGIGHGIHRLATRAPIGKSLDHRAQVLDEAAERVGTHIVSKREAHRRREFAFFLALSALSVGHPLYLSNHLFSGHQLYGPESENQGVAAVKSG